MTQDSEPAPVKSRSLRTSILILVAGVAVCGAAVTTVLVYHSMTIRPNAPSAVELARAGKLTAACIQSIDFLEFDPGDGWPFTERQYSDLRSRRTSSPAAIAELHTILASHAVEGVLHKSHPVTLNYGIVRLNCADGAKYYLYYIYLFRDEYYVSITANSRDELNPNRAKAYHSRKLAAFLRQYDPWLGKVGKD
mgnify:CR=1 FL=1